MLKNLFLCLMSVSLLFAAVVNGLRGETANCVVGAVYGGVLAYVLWLTWHEPRADMAFKRWMRWNEAALRGNGAFYRGSLLRVDTELVAYPLCVSYVAGVTRVWSPYYVRHSRQAICMQIVCTGLTLIFGWWSLPGPIVTIRTLANNEWTETVESVLNRRD